MGGGKPARLLGGVRLIDRAVALARQWTASPVVALRSCRDNGVPDTRVVQDRLDLDGPLAGLAAGVEIAVTEGADRLLLVPADMPFLPANLAERLSEGLEASEAGCAVASSASYRHPVCSLWQLDRLAAELPHYCASARLSLIGLAEAVSAVDVEWSTEGRDPFFNINNERDLAAAEAMLV